MVALYCHGYTDDLLFFYTGGNQVPPDTSTGSATGMRILAGRSPHPLLSSGPREDACLLVVAYPPVTGAGSNNYLY